MIILITKGNPAKKMKENSRQKRNRPPEVPVVQRRTAFGYRNIFYNLI
mgnify:CR=1 FL=1